MANNAGYNEQVSSEIGDKDEGADQCNKVRMLFARVGFVTQCPCPDSPHVGFVRVLVLASAQDAF